MNAEVGKIHNHGKAWEGLYYYVISLGKADSIPVYTNHFILCQQLFYSFMT
jgi:hypothetical protein